MYCTQCNAMSYGRKTDITRGEITNYSHPLQKFYRHLRLEYFRAHTCCSNNSNQNKNC